MVGGIYDGLWRKLTRLNLTANAINIRYRRESRCGDLMVAML